MPHRLAPALAALALALIVAGTALGAGRNLTDQVYVADSVNNRIQVFTRDGAFVRKWGRLGSTNGRFNDPRGVAVDSSDC